MLLLRRLPAVSLLFHAYLLSALPPICARNFWSDASHCCCCVMHPLPHRLPACFWVAGPVVWRFDAAANAPDRMRLLFGHLYVAGTPSTYRKPPFSCFWRRHALMNAALGSMKLPRTHRGACLLSPLTPPQTTAWWV